MGGASSGIYQKFDSDSVREFTPTGCATNLLGPAGGTLTKCSSKSIDVLSLLETPFGASTTRRADSFQSTRLWPFVVHGPRRLTTNAANFNDYSGDGVFGRDRRYNPDFAWAYLL